MGGEGLARVFRSASDNKHDGYKDNERNKSVGRHSALVRRIARITQDIFSKLAPPVLGGHLKKSTDTALREKQAEPRNQPMRFQSEVKNPSLPLDALDHELDLTNNDPLWPRLPHPVATPPSQYADTCNRLPSRQPAEPTDQLPHPTPPPPARPDYDRLPCPNDRLVPAPRCHGPPLNRSLSTATTKSKPRNVPASAGLDNTKTEISVFTDGSAIPNPGPCGAGAFFLTPADIRGMLPPRIIASLGPGDNLAGELWAIGMALEVLLRAPNLNLPNQTRTITLYSDCSPAIGAVFHNWSTTKWTKLALKAQLTLRKLRKYYKVSSVWIPAHTGIPGNEEADRLAKLGATTFADSDLLSGAPSGFAWRPAEPTWPL